MFGYRIHVRGGVGKQNGGVVVVVCGRPGSRLVHTDLESELGAVDVLPPNCMVLMGEVMTAGLNVC